MRVGGGEGTHNHPRTCPMQVINTRGVSLQGTLEPDNQGYRTGRHYHHGAGGACSQTVKTVVAAPPVCSLRSSCGGSERVARDRHTHTQTLPVGGDVTVATGLAEEAMHWAQGLRDGTDQVAGIDLHTAMVRRLYDWQRRLTAAAESNDVRPLQRLCGVWSGGGGDGQRQCGVVVLPGGVRRGAFAHCVRPVEGGLLLCPVHARTLLRRSSRKRPLSVPAYTVVTVGDDPPPTHPTPEPRVDIRLTDPAQVDLFEHRLALRYTHPRPWRGTVALHGGSAAQWVSLFDEIQRLPLNCNVTGLLLHGGGVRGPHYPTALPRLGRLFRERQTIDWIELRNVCCYGSSPPVDPWGPLVYHPCDDPRVPLREFQAALFQRHRVMRMLSLLQDGSTECFALLAQAVLEAGRRSRTRPPRIPPPSHPAAKIPRLEPIPPYHDDDDEPIPGSLRFLKVHLQPRRGVVLPRTYDGGTMQAAVDVLWRHLILRNQRLFLHVGGDGEGDEIRWLPTGGSKYPGSLLTHAPKTRFFLDVWFHPFHASSVSLGHHAAVAATSRRNGSGVERSQRGSRPGPPRMALRARRLEDERRRRMVDRRHQRQPAAATGHGVAADRSTFPRTLRHCHLRPAAIHDSVVPARSCANTHNPVPAPLPHGG